jgi:hypothetical protein
MNPEAVPMIRTGSVLLKTASRNHRDGGTRTFRAGSGFGVMLLYSHYKL